VANLAHGQEPVPGQVVGEVPGGDTLEATQPASHVGSVEGGWVVAEDLIVTNWSAERWTRGCYGAFFPPGAWTAFGHALREPIGPLHWAGTETAQRWMLYMDGAVESGERAATDVIRSAAW
jgi:monoamine oxidase